MREFEELMNNPRVEIQLDETHRYNVEACIVLVIWVSLSAWVITGCMMDFLEIPKI